MTKKKVQKKNVNAYFLCNSNLFGVRITFWNNNWDRWHYGSSDENKRTTINFKPRCKCAHGSLGGPDF